MPNHVSITMKVLPNLCVLSLLCEVLVLHCIISTHNNVALELFPDIIRHVIQFLLAICHWIRHSAAGRRARHGNSWHLINGNENVECGWLWQWSQCDEIVVEVMFCCFDVLWHFLLWAALGLIYPEHFALGKKLPCGINLPRAFHATSEKKVHKAFFHIIECRSFWV